MSLDQPAWFADVDAWWVPTVGEEVAARVWPLGFDSELRLHVECDGRAWTTQVRLLADRLAKRIDMFVPPRHRRDRPPLRGRCPCGAGGALAGADRRGSRHADPSSPARSPGPGAVDAGALCRGP
ncbi:DciA family protein [Streptomyces rimosus]|uniref:DciA family protein n=1 Tax=Streptomyces rimosus TaxID=1927 RepID=UPI0009988426